MTGDTRNALFLKSEALSHQRGLKLALLCRSEPRGPCLGWRHAANCCYSHGGRIWAKHGGGKEGAKTADSQQKQEKKRLKKGKRRRSERQD